MKPEIHLFVIWSKAEDKFPEILKDIGHYFEILRQYQVRWSLNNFSKNLTRFYGENLPPGSHKEEHCGNGPFRIVIVRDLKPKYDFRETTKGRMQVNCNLFDAKMKYRNWAGGGHRIHASNMEKEASHDLMLILGKPLSEFRELSPASSIESFEEVSSDLVGTNGWKTIQEFFHVLNWSNDYIVLRNFECLPDSYHMETHGDIDLLTGNLNEIIYVSNARKVFPEDYRIHFTVNINGEDIYFDFRYLGDQYYDTAWERHMLNCRILEKNGFYRPTEEDYFYGLCYHAAVHKTSIAPDYILRLVNLGRPLNLKNLTEETFRNPSDVKKLLDTYMRIGNYHYTRPKDHSVYYNEIFVDMGKKPHELNKNLGIK